MFIYDFKTVREMKFIFFMYNLLVFFIFYIYFYFYCGNVNLLLYLRLSILFYGGKVIIKLNEMIKQRINKAYTE